MKPYVDKSGEEFSIHQLDSLDLELIFEALIHYGNEIGNSKLKNRIKLKTKVVHIKNKIENELS